MIQLMIADDERIERLVLRRTLEKYLGDTCQIHEAENGRQALAVYRENKIQIAILDIEMRESTASRRQRRSGPRIRTAALSSSRPLTISLCQAGRPCTGHGIPAKALQRAGAFGRFRRGRADHKAAHGTDPACSPQRARGGSRQLPAAGGSQRRLAAGGCCGARQGGHISCGKRPGGGRRRRTAPACSFSPRQSPPTSRQNYRNDISMQDAARAMNYSEAYFCKLFKQCFSCNFTAYLAEYRIGRPRSFWPFPR